MKCVIVAGGLGTRLQPVAGDLPKPMVPLNGVPLLERLIGLCRRFGLVDIHLLLGYRPQAIRDYFGDGSSFGVRLTYYVEPVPAGTAGAMTQMRPFDEDLLVLYGDVFIEMDLMRLLAFHYRQNSIGTLVVHPNDHPQDSDLIELGEGGIVAFHRKPRPADAYYANIVSAGAYVLTPRLLDRIPQDRPADFGADVFPEVVAAGERLAAYNTPEYIKDIGTPERYYEVERDLRSGKPERCNLAHRRKAVFLDRDGTINILVPWLHRPEDLRLYPHAAAAIRALNASDYLSIAITNQPQLARGMLTAAQLQLIHNKLETLLGRERAKLDAIYYCPHHPDSGYPEEVPELKIRCRCRKPGTLLYEQAAERFHIDLAGSAVIGDSGRDLEAARRLGCRAVLVQTGLQGGDGALAAEPDYTARDLLQAVQWVIGVES
jgi:histidinol-phosphate phosphatase family protein